MEMLDIVEKRRNRIESFLFGATLLAATLLYIATKSPVLAAVLPCLHGGWKTFGTGLWVLQSDPCRSRARTCFAFHAAAACWKAAAAALTAVVVFIVAANVLGREPKTGEFAATMLVVAGGVVLNTFLGWGAICAALTWNVRVWVHPHLRAVTGGDLRLVAGLNPHRGGFNHAVFVVATALVFPVVLACVLVVAVLTFGKNGNDIPTTPVLVLELVALFGGPLAMVPCYAWLSSRIIARSPQEGWPEIGQSVEKGPELISLK